jgi:hypothetical protein
LHCCVGLFDHDFNDQLAEYTHITSMLGFQRHVVPMLSSWGLCHGLILQAKTDRKAERSQHISWVCCWLLIIPLFLGENSRETSCYAVVSASNTAAKEANNRMMQSSAEPTSARKRRRNPAKEESLLKSVISSSSKVYRRNATKKDLTV